MAKKVENPIRWAMVGDGRGSQIGYIHRSAALRDHNFQLLSFHIGGNLKILLKEVFSYEYINSRNYA